MEPNIQMTETEITLLVSTGFNERRIRSGELTHVELEDLEIIRYTVQRMEELYPGIRIQYTQMNIGARGGQGYSFSAYDESRGPDEPFTIFTAVSGTPGNRVYACEDNLAGQMLQPEFESLIGKMLAETGLNLHGFSAALPYTVGEQFDRTRTAAQLLEEGQCPACSIRVEIRAGEMDREAFDAAVMKLDQLFRGKGLTGSVLVLGYPTTGSDPLPEAWDSVSFRAQILL